MAKKKDGKSKKADEKAARKKAAEREAKQAKKAAAKQAEADRKAAKKAAKQGKADAKAGKQAEADVKPDQVEVLKLALRDTEAKLVDAEHRLRQVQQQLDDERRALADAAEEAAAEAVVDAAVLETVAEAVADAELLVGDESPAAVAEVVAETLDEVAAEIDPADPEPEHTGEAAKAAAAFTQAVPDGQALTPPLPHEPSPEEPSAEWTLVRLREEAARRGLTGVANLPKARLLERLAQS